MAISLVSSRSRACVTRVIRGQRCDLAARELAGDAAHLRADVVAPIARLERLHLLLKVRALLSAQLRRGLHVTHRPMTRRARCDVTHRIACLDQTARSR